ncbi:hypothetical protein [Primorskyibacter sp. 2E233]|uniref:hypothetical protein n=1 Tax=Primorskyibacter sp. 2E233 TaxID=3413431 RepID=UPI003BF10BA6
MDSTLQSFDKRQKALRRKHKRMAHGYVNKLDKNGLITQRPDSKASGFGLRFLVLAVIGFMIFKAFLLGGLGQEKYLAHVSQLQSGSGFEQAGAMLMQIDPVTEKLGALIGPYLQ